MFWYDGSLVEKDTLELSINDSGLLYGATVFTTLRVYNQSLDHPLTNWKAHCNRLHNSIKSFGWQFPNWERLRQGAEILTSDYPVLRIAIFGDGREWIIGRLLPEDLTERQQQGVVAWVANEPLLRRSLATHKTGNYLGAWLALQKAQKLGAKEAILIDNNGNWLETSTGNLWGYQDGCWWTPPQGNILPGIARSQLLRWLEDNSYSVQETIWTPEFVQDLEAIAYSNSVVEVVPLCNVVYLDDKINLDKEENIDLSYMNFDLFHSALEELRCCFVSSF